MPIVIYRDEVRKQVDSGAQLVEVLPCEEYEEKHITGAINMPLKELDRETTAGLERAASVIVYCYDYL